MGRGSVCRIALWSLFALCAACGGGGGGNKTPPSYVDVVFPPRTCNVEDGTLHVRGVSTGLATVTAVDVAGHAASSADGFATWTVTVPLAFGLNTLPVTAVDDQGNPDPGAFSLHVTRSIQTGPVSSMDYDPATNHVVLLQRPLRLVTKDLTTGAVRVLSGGGVGTGVAFDNPRHVVYDTGHKRAIVSDQGVDDLITVDLDTGNRAKLTNTFFNSPDAMVLDPGGNRVLVTETTIDAVVAVDLTTGARTTLSDAATGTGPAFSLPTSIQYDSATNTAYVLDASLQAILAVNLANGNRTVLADASTGTGGPINESTAIALDLAGGRILLTRSGFHRIQEVDLVTGDHPILISQDGNGPSLDHPNVMVLMDPDDLLVGQGGYIHLLSIHLSTDTRTVVHSWSVGQGPIFDRVSAVGFDADHRRVLVADDFADSLLAVDGNTGDRSVFLQGNQPAGGFGRPQRLRVDADRNVAYVYGDNPIQVVTVNLDSATMDVISRWSDVGMGEPFQFSRDLSYDPTGGVYYLSRGSPDVILAVDETTGDRTIFADAAIGSGESISSVNSLACDVPGRKLYYRPSNGGALVDVIDITTGVRTAVTTNANTGPTTSGAKDMRLDAARNRLVLFGGFDAGVIALSLASGNRQELSGFTVGGGVLPASVGEGDILPAFDLGVYHDYGFESLVLVDLANGDRATLTR